MVIFTIRDSRSYFANLTQQILPTFTPPGGWLCAAGEMLPVARASNGLEVMRMSFWRGKLPRLSALCVLTGLTFATGAAQAQWRDERHAPVRRDERGHEFERHDFGRREFTRRDDWHFDRGRGWRFEHRPGVWSPYHVWWWTGGRVVMLALMASLVSTDRRVSLISPLSLGSTGGEGQSRQHAQRRQPRELTSPEAHSHDLQPVRRARDRQHFARSAEPSAGGGEGR